MLGEAVDCAAAIPVAVRAKRPKFQRVFMVDVLIPFRAQAAGHLKAKWIVSDSTRAVQKCALVQKQTMEPYSIFIGLDVEADELVGYREHGKFEPG